MSKFHPAPPQPHRPNLKMQVPKSTYQLAHDPISSPLPFLLQTVSDVEFSVTDPPKITHLCPSVTDHGFLGRRIRAPVTEPLFLPLCISLVGLRVRTSVNSGLSEYRGIIGISSLRWIIDYPLVIDFIIPSCKLITHNSDS
jgi:hypothetical protein